MTVTHRVSDTATVLPIHHARGRHLQKALHDAVREGLVVRNAALLAKAPRRAVSTRGALTSDEAIRVLLAAPPEQRTRWALAFFTGCRQGEALGLQAEHVHLDRDEDGTVVSGVVDFAWQLQRLPKSVTKLESGEEGEKVHGALWLLRPKTRRSYRRVALPAVLAKDLDAHMTRDPGRFVFHHPDGAPIDQRVDYQAWKDLLKTAKVRDVPLHSARHTTATLLQKLGIDEQTRMEMLGHSSATTTAGYTHIDMGMQHAAMGKLAGLLRIDK